MVHPRTFPDPFLYPEASRALSPYFLLWENDRWSSHLVFSSSSMANKFGDTRFGYMGSTVYGGILWLGTVYRDAVWLQQCVWGLLVSGTRYEIVYRESL